jgi:flagellar hook assembly protein FlgD
MVHALAQNTPNPFNPRTTIKYALPRDEQVNITIYDMRGRVVKVLVSEPKSVGTYEVIWDGVDKRGNRVSSGVYFYRIVAGSFQASKRMLLMK